MPHANAPLTRSGRIRLVKLVEEERLTFEAAAAASNVAKSTVHKWVARRRSACPDQLADGSWADERPSTPHRQPRLTSGTDHDRVCEARKRTGWGPRWIASELALPHATVSRCLARRGLSRRPPAPRGEVVRHEWPCPGDLLQMDTKQFARFSRPGHAVTGDRYRSGAERREKVGKEFAHSVIDDHTRIAYTELHPDEWAETVTAFLKRALAFYCGLGIEPRRVQTDNAWTYTHNRSLAELLEREAISHHTIRPRTPRLNGKVERYQQTLGREWGYGQRYRSSGHRAEALPHWLRHYNEQRRHSAIGNRPPISRIRNVPGQDS